MFKWLWKKKPNYKKIKEGTVANCNCGWRCVGDDAELKALIHSRKCDIGMDIGIAVTTGYSWEDRNV